MRKLKKESAGESGEFWNQIFMIACSFEKLILDYIAKQNNFSFSITTVEELWKIYCCIPVKKIVQFFGGSSLVNLSLEK